MSDWIKEENAKTRKLIAESNNHVYGKEIRSMSESQLMDDPEYLYLMIAKERIFDHPESEHYASVYINRKYLERMGYQRIKTREEY